MQTSIIVYIKYHSFLCDAFSMLVLDNVVICVIVPRIMVKNNVKAKKYATF